MTEEEAIKIFEKWETVFCNPPYSSRTKSNPGQDAWVRKCWEESKKPGTTVVALLPSRTDTARFHDYILGKAEIRFIRGRVRFIDHGKPAGTPLFGSIICIWRSVNKNGI